MNDVHLDVVHKQRKPPAQDLRRFGQLELNFWFYILYRADLAVVLIVLCYRSAHGRCTNELAIELGISSILNSVTVCNYVNIFLHFVQVILKQQLDQIDNAIAKIYQCQVILYSI